MAGIPNKVFAIDKGQAMTWAGQAVVASGAAATIAANTPTKTSAADASIVGAVVPMVDGDGSVTAMRFSGLAKNTSTDTASAAGVVDVWVPVPGLLYRGLCKVAGSANTQAKINALFTKRVVFDLTSSDWTVDSAAADALVNCVVIMGGIPANDEILFVYSPKGTSLDTSTSM